MDRLGFWGDYRHDRKCRAAVFQYPLMDRLGFWGLLAVPSSVAAIPISVSADGSTWFLGIVAPLAPGSQSQFQYPLMDRLGFWG